MKNIIKYATCLIALFLCIVFITAPAHAATYDCAAGRHKDTVIARVEPTATQDGYETLKCDLCGRQYDAILYATAHVWGEWVIDRAATCTEPGKQHRTCNLNAPHSETETIPALGHDYKLTVRKPTCKEAGLKTYNCTRCHHTYTEPGDPALEHNYIGIVTKEPNCLEEGIKTFACSYDPEDTYTEPIPALGHILGEWTVEIPAKEGIDGKEIRACIRCGYREERVVSALDVPEKPPLFNVVDAVAGGIDFGLIVLFFISLAQGIRTINKERRDYKAYQKRIKDEETEADKHEFH